MDRGVAGATRGYVGGHGVTKTWVWSGVGTLTVAVSPALLEPTALLSFSRPSGAAHEPEARAVLSGLQHAAGHGAAADGAVTLVADVSFVDV